MKCVIEIDIETSAFGGSADALPANEELARILRELAQKCEEQGIDYHRQFTIKDSHTLEVGILKFVDQPFS